MAQRHADPHVKAAADVGQTEVLPAGRRDLHAQAAVDALARLEEDVGMADVLLVFPPLRLEAARVGAVQGRVLPQPASRQGAAIAMQAARGLLGGRRKLDAACGLGNAEPAPYPSKAAPTRRGPSSRSAW